MARIKAPTLWGVVDGILAITNPEEVRDLLFLTNLEVMRCTGGVLHGTQRVLPYASHDLEVLGTIVDLLNAQEGKLMPVLSVSTVSLLGSKRRLVQFSMEELLKKKLCQRSSTSQDSTLPPPPLLLLEQA